MSDGLSPVRIAALTVYPVKGCAGIEVPEWPIFVEGLAHDREWVIVDDAGEFVSQRECPALARVRVTLEAGALVLMAPDAGTLRVDLAPVAATSQPVSIWSDTVHAHDAGPQASQWLGALLHQRLCLMRFAPQERRLCDPRYAGDSRARVRFADAFPLLVLSRESVADLGQRMGAPALEWQRFRPNLLIEGLSPYEEDLLETLETDEVSVALVKPCTRCSVPSVDPVRGVSTPVDPLAALLGYRYDARLQGATLGMNALLLRGEGVRLRVSQTLHANHRWAG